MNQIQKDLQQHSITISHINLYLKKVDSAENEEVKYRMINKTVGILSLAKVLDIITSDEYEFYFKQLYM